MYDLIFAVLTLTGFRGVLNYRSTTDREAIDWAASTVGYDSSTVQNVMLRSVGKRFGDRLPDTALQWLTDNGSTYTANETRRFRERA